MSLYNYQAVNSRPHAPLDVLVPPGRGSVMLSSLVWWHSRVRLGSRKRAIRLWHALSCIYCQDFGRFDKSECVSGGARCGAADSGSQRLAALRVVECGVNEARSAPAHRPAAPVSVRLRSELACRVQCHAVPVTARPSGASTSANTT